MLSFSLALRSVIAPNRGTLELLTDIKPIKKTSSPALPVMSLDSQKLILSFSAEPVTVCLLYSKDDPERKATEENAGYILAGNTSDELGLTDFSGVKQTIYEKVAKLVTSD